MLLLLGKTTLLLPEIAIAHLGVDLIVNSKLIFALSDLSATLHLVSIFFLVQFDSQLRLVSVFVSLLGEQVDMRSHSAGSSHVLFSFEGIKLGR